MASVRGDGHQADDASRTDCGVKFLIDAHLPPSLCRSLAAEGHDAIHTSGLPDGSSVPIG